MAYSEPLAARVRALLRDRDDVEERPMDFTARPMRGFVTVAPDGLNGRALRAWVERAVAHAETQPPKRRAVKP
jgi:hypothetical protein